MKAAKSEGGLSRGDWLEENNPFDLDRDKQLLVSFSTGFTSTANDTITAERVAKAREGDADKDQWTVSDIYHGGKVQGTGPVIAQKDSQGQGKKIHISCSSNR